jgi:hypothetical protein
MCENNTAFLLLSAGSLGPNTWVPWCYAMLAAIVIFAANGFYQHRSWWLKGGKETVFAEVDTITRLPSTSGASNTFGRSFQVGSTLNGFVDAASWLPTQGCLGELCIVKPCSGLGTITRLPSTSGASNTFGKPFQVGAYFMNIFMHVKTALQGLLLSLGFTGPQHKLNPAAAWPLGACSSASPASLRQRVACLQTVLTDCILPVAVPQVPVGSSSSALGNAPPVDHMPSSGTKDAAASAPTDAKAIS